MILEAVNPPHISIEQSAATRGEEATHNTPTAPSRHPLSVRRQTATTAAAQRGIITAASASPGLIGNTDGLHSRSSRNPPHISIQRAAARTKEAIHNTQHTNRTNTTSDSGSPTNDHSSSSSAETPSQRHKQAMSSKETPTAKV